MSGWRRSDVVDRLDDAEGAALAVQRGDLPLDLNDCRFLRWCEDGADFFRLDLEHLFKLASEILLNRVSFLCRSRQRLLGVGSDRFGQGGEFLLPQPLLVRPANTSELPVQSLNLAVDVRVVPLDFGSLRG